MNVWTNAVITDKGLALLAKLTQGNTLDIVEAVSGAGWVTPGLLQKQTEITDPRTSLTFRPVSYPETGACSLPMVMSNEGVTEGYEATQVGAFANDPDEGKILFFIAQSVDASNGTTIPSETEMPGFSAEWTFKFQYGQADSVNVTVDPSNTVTRAELEEALKGSAKASDTTPKAPGTAAVGSETTSFARGDHVHPMQESAKGITTEGTGAAYTATVAEITALTAGVSFIMIPHTASTSKTPTLNVNGLGAKTIRRRLSNNSTTTVASVITDWLGANKPVRVTYDGLYWIADLNRPNAEDMWGSVPVENGGTGASTADEARVNLGVETQGGTVTSGNADYAEVGEWTDGNPNAEDRVGYFVCIDMETDGIIMKKATSDDDVRGVTVAAPAFSGGCSPDKFDSSGNLLNKYDYVAVMGIVPVIDNGRCNAGDRCMPTTDSTAVPVTGNYGYQVIARVDSTHVLIAVEPGADCHYRMNNDIQEIVPITRGGTGATTAYAARINLGIITIDEIVNLYVWKKYTGDPNINETDQGKIAIASSNIPGVSYADSIEVSEDGEIYLVNPTTVDLTKSNKDVVLGKYIYRSNGSQCMRIPSDASITVSESSSNSWTIYSKPLYHVTFGGGKKVGYAASKENTTYPTNGEHEDGYWYVYHKQVGD
ncbi:MAG: hypothetical protein ACI4PO_09150 [Faecousia sp.]